MKLATWNVRRPTEKRGERQRRLAAVIGDIHADIWVLTETVRSLVPGSEFAGEHTDTPDRASTPDEAWVSVWTRFPISQRLPTRDPARSVAVRIETPGRPTVVFGTVLPWLGSRWKQFPGADGVAFQKAVELQREDWLAIRAAHSDADLVVAGDLNQDLSARHYYGSARNRATLEAALASAGLAALTAAPHDPIPKHAPRYAAIDHICALADSVRWNEARRASWPQRASPDEKLSDHFGLSVDVRAG